MPRAPLPPISKPDEPLQMDSLDSIRLAAFLESLGIRIEDEELLAQDFQASARSESCWRTSTPRRPRPRRPVRRDMLPAAPGRVEARPFGGFRRFA
ncbi:MAG: acyl carrier protein [Chthoniobacterales bacterium]|nr:acyl carrier protein [Chthoniobacterales bacterium]